MYVDILGKRLPNRLGNDIFLIGVGSNADGKPFKSVNPYVWQDNNDSNGSYGICRYVADRTCNADDGKSPTAYVLAHDKLPDLKAMGYPK
jgi:hypothetical protein